MNFGVVSFLLQPTTPGNKSRQGNEIATSPELARLLKVHTCCANRSVSDISLGKFSFPQSKVRARNNYLRERARIKKARV
jgi:hypothetical protein